MANSTLKWRSVRVRDCQLVHWPRPLPLQPKVVTDVEDEELRTQMEELRLANQEVGGDDDTSDVEDFSELQDKALQD